MITLHNLSKILESNRAIQNILQMHNWKSVENFKSRLKSVADGPNGDDPPDIRKVREAEAKDLLNAILALGQAVSAIEFAPILGPDTRV